VFTEQILTTREQTFRLQKNQTIKKYVKKSLPQRRNINLLCMKQTKPNHDYIGNTKLGCGTNYDYIGNIIFPRNNQQQQNKKQKMRL
jgi:hypothetical protein